MFKNNRSLIALLLCLVLALGACAPAAQPEAAEPTAAPVVSAEPTAEPAPAPTAEPAPAPAPTEEPAPAPAFKAGTYTTTGMGRNGYMEVECVFSDNRIEEVNILSDLETKAVGDIALEQIAAEVVEYQSLAVDAVAGATATSAGLRAAIVDCVQQAGGDVNALMAVEVPDAITEPVEKTADVIVVGAGGAGFAAALSALENGASVILIETNGIIGGNTLVSGMAWNAVDYEANKSIVPTDGQIVLLDEFVNMELDSVDEEYRPVLSTLKQQIADYLETDRSYLFDSEELHIMQFWTGCVREGLDGTYVKPDLEVVKQFVYNSMDTLNWAKSYGVNFKPGIGTVAGGLWQRGHTVSDRPEAFANMLSHVEEMGGEVMLNIRANELIVENGAVVGVKGLYKKEVPVTLNAEKAVILTCGGFGGNKEMADEYNNYWPAGLLNTPSDQIASTQGDGIAMAVAIGADVEGMGYTQLFPAVNIVTNDRGPVQGWGGNDTFYCNIEGKRFVNEYAERDVMSIAVLNQPEARHFQVYDSTELEKVRKNRPDVTDEWLQSFVDRDAFYIADTIEEAAEYIGCDPAVLQETFDSFNQAVLDNYDPLTGRTVFEHQLNNPPYYLSPVCAQIHNTMGGLKVNPESAVVDTEGNAIPGLFAAGEVTGGIHAGNRLGGNAIGEAFTMGRNAGANAAK